ncbi:Serine/threonine protein kinase [Pseudogymnoascus australis]
MSQIAFLENGKRDLSAPDGDLSVCYPDIFSTHKAIVCSRQPLKCPVPFKATLLPTPSQSPDAPVANNIRYVAQQLVQQKFQRFSPSTPPTAKIYEAQFLDASQRLQFLRPLGSGAYGIVHLVEDVAAGKQYAMKVLDKYSASGGLPLDARQQPFPQTEVQLHYGVAAHPNIVSLLRVLDVEDCTYVVMEYCREGDLFLNITERHRYVGNDFAVKTAFLQILDAVAHCHRLGVYHRDLKPENILVSDGGQIKLADFGLATTDSFSSDFGCGTPFYMSPECQDQSSGKPFYACAPNDIWSLGVILVNLTCRRNPWKSASVKDSTFRAYLEDREFLKTILPLSDELSAILTMIFEIDPVRRISLAELRHRVAACPAITKSATPALEAGSPDFKVEVPFDFMDEDPSYDDFTPVFPKDRILVPSVAVNAPCFTFNAMSPFPFGLN